MNVATPTYISLFAGAGGLDLAVRLAVPESRCVCFVEREIPAAGVLAARMQDGCFHEAPIWSDVRTFDGLPWRGIVDGIIGGFPCTDLSVAGKQEGIHGEHSGLFFEYVRIIREVQPGWIFIENVPPVLSFPSGGTVLGELAALGLDAEWRTIRASDVGAPHRRDRAFILAYRPRFRWGEGRAESGREQGGSNAVVRNGELAYARCERDERWGARGLMVCSAREVEANGEQRQRRRDAADDCKPELAHTTRDERDRLYGESGSRRGVCEGGGALADAECPRWAEAGSGCGLDAGRESEQGCLPMDDAECPERRTDTEPRGCSSEGADGRREAASWAGESDISVALAGGEGLPIAEPTPIRGTGWRDEGGATPELCLPFFPPGPGDTARWERIIAERPDLAPAVESGVRGLADELAARVDRLRAGGNGVVAIQGAIAFILLARRAIAAQEAANNDR